MHINSVEQSRPSVDPQTQVGITVAAFSCCTRPCSFMCAVVTGMQAFMPNHRKRLIAQQHTPAPSQRCLRDQCTMYPHQMIEGFHFSRDFLAVSNQMLPALSREEAMEATARLPDATAALVPHSDCAPFVHSS